MADVNFWLRVTWRKHNLRSHQDSLQHVPLRHVVAAKSAKDEVAQFVSLIVDPDENMTASCH